MQTVLDAYNLFHEGSTVLAEIEANGMAVDEIYLDRAIRRIDAKIARMEAALYRTDEWKLWKRTFKEETSLLSTQQLGRILFEELGIECKERTAKTGKPKTTEAALEAINLPFVKDYFTVKKLKKAKATYLEGLKRETVNGFVHPFYSLGSSPKDDAEGGASTYRSSCTDPNIMNQPVRNPEMAKIIRKSFITRSPKNRLVEIDYSALEFRIAACFWKDPLMLQYASDKSKDIHRDMAMKCYKLSKAQVDKQSRYCAKNQFVFPKLYGSWYKPCAKNLWESIDKMSLKTVDGIALKDHLRNKGIHNLGSCDPKDKLPTQPGTFVHHIKKCEEDFEKLFPTLTENMNQWNESYRSKGSFPMMTGFVLHGLYTKNQLLNMPIQGCLPGHSRILTEEGWIPIEELVGKKSLVWTGFKWAEAVGLNRGQCQRVTVKLSSGLIVECDTRHKFKNEKDEWVHFDNLKVGGYVALPKVSQNQIQPSKEMTWEFLLGFIIGDGYLAKVTKSPTNTRRCLSITVGIKKKPILDEIDKFLKNCGYKTRRYVRPPKDNRKEKYTLDLENRKFSRLLEEKGIVWGWKHNTKRIPESIWRSGSQQQRDFLEGVWKSDGSRGKWQEGNLNMKNPELLRELQVLAAPLGYDSIKTGIHLRFNWKEGYSISPRLYPASRLTGQVKEIKRRKNYPIPNEHTSDKRVFGLAQSGINATQFTAERIVSINSPEELIYRYDKVVSIEVHKEEQTTYTMAVNDSLHQFVADGVIAKNTAFHCLLWSLIQMHRRLLQREMKSLVIAEIHDSMLLDVPDDEVQTVLNLARKIMTVDIRKHFDWIVIPLEIEADVTPLGKSWHEKEPWICGEDGKWIPKMKKD